MLTNAEPNHYMNYEKLPQEKPITESLLSMGTDVGQLILSLIVA